MELQRNSAHCVAVKCQNYIYSPPLPSNVVSAGSGGSNYVPETDKGGARRNGWVAEGPFRFLRVGRPQPLLFFASLILGFRRSFARTDDRLPLRTSAASHVRPAGHGRCGQRSS